MSETGGSASELPVCCAGSGPAMAEPTERVAEFVRDEARERGLLLDEATCWELLIELRHPHNLKHPLHTASLMTGARYLLDALGIAWGEPSIRHEHRYGHLRGHVSRHAE